jgi:thiol-disulfide isomerase/thioredoxin
MKIKILFLTLMLWTLGLHAEQPIQPLKIGDKLPDIVLRHLLDKPGLFKLSSLNNKDLLIINFWATWCVPCIQELPRLDSLAKINKPNLNVLTVAYETKNTVNTFFQKHTEIKTNDMVMITDDKILSQYFIHHVLPHNVWINRRGIIKNITGADEITQENVKTFFKEQSLAVHNTAIIPNFDVFAPFHLSDSIFEYRSILTKYIDGIPGGNVTTEVFHHPTETWLIRDFAFNYSRQQLLWTAVDRDEYSQDYYGIMKIETTDSSKFFWPKQCPLTFGKSKYKTTLDWQLENAYCYELTLPQAYRDTDFYGYMLSDLERAFHLKVIKKEEIIPTCVISLTGGFSFNRCKDDSSFINLTSQGIKAHNVSIMRLFNFLNKKVKVDKNDKCDDPPYIDETGIEHNIDLELTFDQEKPRYIDIKGLIKSKYGINFIIIKKPYPLTIIRDLTP